VTGSFGLERLVMNLLKYGPGKKFVRFSVWLSWPIMIAAKKWSSYPILKWIINPFFAYPYNEVTAIPIHQEVPQPDNVVVPRRVVERLLSEVTDIFILDACICRNKMGCENHPTSIGCIALGPAISRMHPSHGHRATQGEAIAHVRKAADAGLVANVAHVWIDPFAFGLTRFHQLMFICFCDDCCCLYRTYLQKRGPNLDRAYKRLPGISVEVDPEKCEGCGVCVDRCFVAAMRLSEGKAVVGESCKACGRCVDNCPHGAVSLVLDNEDALFEQLIGRIKEVADIWQAPANRSMVFSEGKQI
jgi:ferredoxin